MIAFELRCSGTIAKSYAILRKDGRCRKELWSMRDWRLKNPVTWGRNLYSKWSRRILQSFIRQERLRVKIHALIPLKFTIHRSRVRHGWLFMVISIAAHAFLSLYARIPPCIRSRICQIILDCTRKGSSHCALLGAHDVSTFPFFRWQENRKLYEVETSKYEWMLLPEYYRLSRQVSRRAHCAYRSILVDVFVDSPRSFWGTFMCSLW